MRKLYWLVTAMLVACAGQEPEPPRQVLLEGKPDQEELDERMADRQARMNIQVKINGASRSLRADELVTIAKKHCNTIVLPTGSDRIPTGVTAQVFSPCYHTEYPFMYYSLGGCTAAMCRVQYNMCVAQRLMEFATTTGTANADYYETFVPAGYVRVEIPPQPAEAKVALAGASYAASAEATWTAGANLQNLAFIRPIATGATNGYGYSVSCSFTSGDASATQAEVWSAWRTAYPSAPYYARTDVATNMQANSEAIAMGLVEGTRVATEATELYTEQNLGVSDAEFSRTRDTATASLLAWSDASMSRAAAAHMNVGGSGALHYFWGQGICPIPNPSNDQKDAISIMRRSAIDPRILQSDLSIASIIEGTNATPAESLRMRLAERTPEADLRVMDAPAFAAYHDLSLDDFAFARQYLKHEARAFGRDLTAALPPAPVGRTAGGNVFTSTPNYSATAVVPTGAPDQYYVGIARFAEPWSETNSRLLEDRDFKHASCTSDVNCGTWEMCTPGTFNGAAGTSFCMHVAGAPVTPTPMYAFRSLAHLTDYAATVAHDVGPRLSQATGALPQSVPDIIASFGLEARKQAPARVETCYRAQTGTNPDVFRIRVMGHADPRRLRVVRGIGGLRCAETGSIEGASCTMATVELGTPTTTVASTASLNAAQRVVGFTEYTEFLITTDLATRPADWVYVVQQKDGYPSDRPGSYVGISALQVERMRTTNPNASFNPNLTPTATTPSLVDVWSYCSLAPVVPELTRKAAEILAPNPQNCGAPKTNCAGFDFADRIPLENEITEDGFDPESSWRHYLDEAISSANYADELGQELINHGFEIDKAIETAQAELEGVCGVPVSLRDVAWGSLDDARAGNCTRTADCPSGYECLNTQCVTSVDETLKLQAMSPDAQALLECIGNDTVANFVTAGSDTLCAWQAASGNGGFNAGLCEGAVSADIACPFVKDLNKTCEQSLIDAKVANVKAVTVDQKLSLFDPIPPRDVADLNQNANKIDCSLIERLRGAPDQATLDELVGKLQLTPEKVQTIALRIGWDGYPNDYSAVTLDGQPFITTGDPQVTGPAPVVQLNKWPCGVRGPTVPDARNPPGCTFDPAKPMVENCVSDCADDTNARADRVRMNHQLARAVLALKLGAGMPLSNVSLPFVPDTTSYVWMFDKDEEACNGSGSSDCDFEGFRWLFDSPGVTPIFGGRELRSTDALIYHAWESNNDNEDKDFAQTGNAFCHHTTNTSPIWTQILGDGTLVPWTPSCATEGQRNKNDGASPSTAILFKPYVDMGSDSASAARVWSNMHPSNPMDANSAYELEGLVYNLLKGSKPTNAAVFSKTTTQINNGDAFTRYFHLCYGSTSRESYCFSRPNEYEFNKIPIPASGELTGNDLLNGLELLCQVAAQESFSCEDVAVAPPGSLQDLRFAKRALECVGQEIENGAAMTILQNVPDSVLPENVKQSTYAGTRGAELSTLIGSFNRLISAQRDIGSELQDLADDVEILRASLKRTGISKQIAQINTEAEVFDRTTACINSTLGALSGTFALVPGSGGGGSQDGGGSSLIFNPVGFIAGAGQTASTCVNSFAQIALAYERLALQEEDLELQSGMTWASFKTQFRNHADTIDKMKLTIDTELAALQGALGAIETQRITAQRHLSQALMATSDATGRTFATNAILRARYNTTRVRYDEALSYAKKMAYMSRRALEQRVGIDLMDIDEDLAFVESPSSWVSEVCTFGGVNYEAIASGEVSDYSKTFIGDYVRRLERVKESYDVDFPFTEGVDTAVISMRDDIVMSRAMCSSSVNNYLGRSADLAADDWQSVGCTPLPAVLPECNDTVDAAGNVTYDQTACGSGDPYTRACISAAPIANVEPMPNVHQDGTAIEGFTVTFGKRESISSVTSLNPGVTALAQDVVLSPGIYRLSWRAPDVAAYDGKDAVRVFQTVTNEISDGMGHVTITTSTMPVTATAKFTTTVAQGWPAHYMFFQLPDSKEPLPVRVQVTSNSATSSEHSVQIGAFMLEDVTGELPWTAVQTLNPLYEPGGYIATTEPGAALLQVCEDTTGEYFRDGWTYGCALLCPSGYETCKGGARQCYYEKSFNLSLEDVESESVLSHAGFAYGNYNYRIDSLGFNFVGTGTRNCDDSAFPSTCFASGYIPVSVYHDGPFDVRNHLGEKYEAALFRGVVEHGRGLAAERYLTNPVSSADQELIGPYLRQELAGRPLAGRFTVRVWEQDGASFDEVEDVQLLLNYRYWTRAQ